MYSTLRNPDGRAGHRGSLNHIHASGARHAASPDVISTGSPAMPSIQIEPVSDAAGWAHARALVLEHVYWWTSALGIREPLAVEPGIREELADLATSYTPPHGIRYLAWLDGQPVGTAGILAAPGGVAEMKRLFVRPAARGHRLGERLVAATLTGAAALGCHTIRLATKPGLMDAAIEIYRRMGFRDIPPFGDLDVEDALYLQRPVPINGAPTEIMQ